MLQGHRKKLKVEERKQFQINVIEKSKVSPWILFFFLNIANQLDFKSIT